LRHNWQYNPGYVAATVAGTIGLVLTASLLIQTGIGLLTDDPEPDDSAIESAEFGQDDLGEFQSREQRALIARLRAQDREASRLNAALDEADADDSTDPFGDPLPQIGRSTRPMEDKENTDDAEPEEPARKLAAAAPNARPHILSDSDDADDEVREPERPVFEPARLRIAETIDRDDETVPVEPIVRMEPATPDAEEAPVPYRRHADRPARRDQWQRTADIGSIDTSIPDDDDPVISTRDQPLRYQPAAASIAARRSTPLETVIVPARGTQPPVAAPRRAPKVADSRFPVAVSFVGPPSAKLDEPCDLEVRLTNNGSQIVRDLVISLELPDGLRHAVAQSLEQQVDALPPGKTHRAVVHLRPRQTGELVVQAEVATADRANVKLRTKVHVGTRSSSTTSAAACLPCLQ